MTLFISGQGIVACSEDTTVSQAASCYGHLRSCVGDKYEIEADIRVYQRVSQACIIVFCYDAADNYDQNPAYSSEA